MSYVRDGIVRILVKSAETRNKCAEVEIIEEALQDNTAQMHLLLAQWHEQVYHHQKMRMEGRGRTLLRLGCERAPLAGCGSIRIETCHLQARRHEKANLRAS